MNIELRVEIHKQMAQAYDDAAPTLSFVKQWIILFKNGRTNLEDLPRSGKPINEESFSSAQSIYRCSEA